MTGEEIMNELKDAGLVQGDPEKAWKSTPNGEIGFWINLYQRYLAKHSKPDKPILGDYWKDGEVLKCWDGGRWVIIK